MVNKAKNAPAFKTSPFTIRKLAKSGNTRYLSLGSILPTDWVAVKVFVVSMKDGICLLRLEQIK